LEDKPRRGGEGLQGGDFCVKFGVPRKKAGFFVRVRDNSKKERKPPESSRQGGDRVPR